MENGNNGNGDGGQGPNLAGDLWEKALAEIDESTSAGEGDSAKTKEQLIEENQDDILRCGKKLRQTQESFIERVKDDEKNGVVAMPEEEFIAVEDVYSQDLAHLTDDLKRDIDLRYGARETYNLRDSESAALTPLYTLRIGNDLKRTVEAYAGHYYYERNRAIIEAINNSDEPERRKELKISMVRDLVGAVERYAETREGSDDRDRTRAHNVMIGTINKVNKFARECGVRPLTARDFLTSDDSQTWDPGTVKEKMRYDRESAWAYCQVAFGDELRRAQQKRDRENGIFHFD